MSDPVASVSFYHIMQKYCTYSQGGRIGSKQLDHSMGICVLLGLPHPGRSGMPGLRRPCREALASPALLGAPPCPAPLPRAVPSQGVQPTGPCVQGK